MLPQRRPPRCSFRSKNISGRSASAHGAPDEEEAAFRGTCPSSRTHPCQHARNPHLPSSAHGQRGRWGVWSPQRWHFGAVAIAEAPSSLPANNKSSKNPINCLATAWAKMDHLYTPQVWVDSPLVETQPLLARRSEYTHIHKNCSLPANST